MKTKNDPTVKFFIFFCPWELNLSDNYLACLPVELTQLTQFKENSPDYQITSLKMDGDFWIPAIKATKDVSVIALYDHLESKAYLNAYTDYMKIDPAQRPNRVAMRKDKSKKTSRKTAKK